MADIPSGDVLVKWDWANTSRTLQLILLACSLLAVASLAALPRDGVKLSEAELRFSTEMFQTIAAIDYKKDVLFSPYSIYSTILTLYLASAGETRTMIQHVVRFHKYSMPDSIYISHEFFNEDPTNGTKPYELVSYDRIYVSPTVQVKSDLGKRIEEKGFIQKMNDVREDDINDWVSFYTQGMITELLKQGSITKDDLFIIANVAYFKGYWTTPLTGGTSKKPFTLSDGTVTQTLFMSVKDKAFKSMTDRELKAQVISLPYKGDNIDMIVILPTTRPKKKAPPPIADVVKKLTYTLFQKILSALKSKKTSKTDLLIPKFEAEETYELKPVFQTLGDEDLFTQSLFLPVYFENGQQLKISLIVHKAKVNVLENGTEAAAASALVGIRSSAKQPKTTFHADHPFVYIIYDQAKCFIHYMGILNKPKEH